MRCLLDGHNIPERNFMFNLMASSELFQAKKVGNTIFLSPDYNQTMEEQRDVTLARILFLREKGVFKGWLTDRTQESDLKRSALFESFGIFDHSLAIKLGVHIHLWYVCQLKSKSVLSANWYKAFRHVQNISIHFVRDLYSHLTHCLVKCFTGEVQFSSLEQSGIMISGCSKLKII